MTLSILLYCLSTCIEAPFVFKYPMFNEFEEDASFLSQSKELCFIC